MWDDVLAHTSLLEVNPPSSAMQANTYVSQKTVFPPEATTTT
jgi:hypothetical protein